MTAKESIAIDGEGKTAARGTAKKTKAPASRAKSPASKSTSAKTSAAGTDSTKRTTAKRPNGKKPAIIPEERQRMISQAAYLISRQRGLTPGTPEADWIHAEVVIDMIFDVA